MAMRKRRRLYPSTRHGMRRAPFAGRARSRGVAPERSIPMGGAASGGMSINPGYGGGGALQTVAGGPGPKPPSMGGAYGMNPFRPATGDVSIPTPVHGGGGPGGIIGMPDPAKYPRPMQGGATPQPSDGFQHGLGLRMGPMPQRPVPSPFEQGGRSPLAPGRSAGPLLDAPPPGPRVPGLQGQNLFKERRPRGAPAAPRVAASGGRMRNPFGRRLRGGRAGGFGALSPRAGRRTRGFGNPFR